MTEKINLLLIDNEPESLEARLKWLEEDRFDVTLMPTLTGAWWFIEDCNEKGDLPLILLDIMMPTIDDLDWLLPHEKETSNISAPTAGLLFAEKLKKTYPNIQVAWHSVRHKDENAVAIHKKKLGFELIQKDLQNKPEFLQEIHKAYKL